MKKIFNLICVLSLIGIVGCEKINNGGGSPNGSVNEKSYIQGFLELNYMYIRPISGFKVDKATHTIVFDTSIPTLYETANGVGISVSIGSESVGKGLISFAGGSKYKYLYDELVQRIGDVSFNLEKKTGFRRIKALADTLQSITITCDKALSEEYPAGSNLNECFDIYFEDPYATIKNGYKSSKGENYYTIDAFSPTFPYSLFGANLASVNLATKFHIGLSWFLILDTVPENTGEYVFTLSVTNTKGETNEGTAVQAIKLKGRK